MMSLRQGMGALWRRRAVGQVRWTAALDFVGPRVRTASWAWLLLLAGLTSAAWVWPMVMQSDADLVQAQLDLKRLQRAVHQHQLQTTVVTAEPDRAARVGLGDQGLRHGAQLAQWLAYPWVRVLDQVEVAAQREQAVMLSFSLDIGSLAASADVQPQVHLVAAVRDDASALRWTQALGPSAQLQVRERLAQPFTSVDGSYDWRVEATWSGELP